MSTPGISLLMLCINQELTCLFRFLYVGSVYRHRLLHDMINPISSWYTLASGNWYTATSENWHQQLVSVCWIVATISTYTMATSVEMSTRILRIPPPHICAYRFKMRHKDNSHFSAAFCAMRLYFLDSRTVFKYGFTHSSDDMISLRDGLEQVREASTVFTSNDSARDLK